MNYGRGEVIRKRWPLLAILLANALAAITLFWAGMWAAETNRYDGCQYVDVGAPSFWACPAERSRPAPPTSEQT
ncbi:MAG: hypothetical protein K0S82_13 [Gaiellaceae bacterium]|jgi:hypothetical protein|nr:hypothetical protein [Gaiellaceae bacterium]